MASLAPGAIALTVKLDSTQLRQLRTLAATSKLAAAKALTFTAQKAIPAWQAANRRTFHMRRDWINKGVRMRAATPGNLSAQVGSVDRYMARHVVGIGEEKRGHLFIPVYSAISQVRTHTQMRRTLKSADSSQRKPFRMILASGKELIVRRRGKKRSPLQILGVVQEGADIPEHLDALGVVSAVVRAEFGPVYERVLLAALERRGA